MLKKVSKNKVRVRRHLRIRKKVNGTASAPRLSVFRSNAHIHCQLIDDASMTTLVSCSSLDMKLANGSNIEAATKVGEELAKRALAKNIEVAVFDRGGYIYHGRIKALAEAAREAGLKI